MTTIDLTPTWAGLLPALLAAVSDGTAEGRQIAMEELKRMAGAADRWNENAGKMVAALNRAVVTIEKGERNSSVDEWNATLDACHAAIMSATKGGA